MTIIESTESITRQNMKTNYSNHPAGKALLFACVLSAFAIASANAVLVTWEFNPSGQNANAGSGMITYNQSGYDLTVRGYDNVAGADPLHQLYYKNDAPNGGAMERGLGLVGTGSNEFTVGANGSPENYLQLDLRSILMSGFSNGMIQVASLQAGESYTIFGSNALGTMGVQLGGPFAGLALDNVFVAIPDFGTYQFISIAAASGRVLPVAFRADITPIPEMSAFFPFVGLLVAVSATRVLRRRRAAQADEFTV